MITNELSAKPMSMESELIEILERISWADEHSPIAVFNFKRYTNTLTAVFANTFQTRKLIAKGDNLVGVYHRKMVRSDYKKQIVKAMNQNSKKPTMPKMKVAS